MEMCAEDTLGQTWDCLRESNGEFLPFILMVECFLWIFVIAGVVNGNQRVQEMAQSKEDGKDKWKHD